MENHTPPVEINIILDVYIKTTIYIRTGNNKSQDSLKLEIRSSSCGLTLKWI